MGREIIADLSVRAVLARPFRKSLRAARHGMRGQIGAPWRRRASC